MSADWPILRRELAAFRAASIPLPIWWRDDDTVAPSPTLDQLEKMGRDLSVPVHIAVIPEPACPALATAVTQSPWLVPVVHGWRHKNHAPENAKKAEFGQPRRDGLAELTEALERMQDLFGDSLVPMFVPPWNRLHSSYLEPLVQIGFTSVSSFTPRSAAHPVAGLVQINTHIDPIDWHGTRDLKPTEQMLAEIAALLHDRRTGAADPTEPLGLLTHHIVHTPQIWEFSARLIAELLDGGAHVSQTDPRKEPLA